MSTSEILAFPNWYCLQVSEGKEEKTIASVYKLLLSKQEFSLIRSISFKVPRSEGAQILFPGYVFLRCELTAELYNFLSEIFNSISAWIKWISKKRYSRIKKGEEFFNAKPLFSYYERVTTNVTKSEAFVVLENLIPNSPVEIFSGPFKSFKGIFKSIVNEEEVSVSILILGRLVDVIIRV